MSCCEWLEYGVISPQKSCFGSQTIFSQTWSRRSSLKNKGLLKKPNLGMCCNSFYIFGQRLCSRFVLPAENDWISIHLHEKIKKCLAILTHGPQRYSILTDSFNEPYMKGHPWSQGSSWQLERYKEAALRCVMTQKPLWVGGKGLRGKQNWSLTASASILDTSNLVRDQRVHWGQVEGCKCLPEPTKNRAVYQS